MSTNNNGPGGVRNLRAMFENKSTELSTSPPSRGRSPAESDLSGPARPVSKVRASFVAVERPGELGHAPQWGLQKTSDIGSMDTSKEETMNGISERQSNGTTGGKGSQAPSANATLLNGQHISNGGNRHGQEVSESQEDSSPAGGLGAILKGSPFEPYESVQQPESSTTIANTSSKIQEKSSLLPKINGTSSKASGSTVSKIKEQIDSRKPKSSVTGQLNTGKTAALIHPPAIGAVQSESKIKSPTARSPTSTRSPQATTAAHLRIKGGPAKIQAVMASARNARATNEHTLSANAEVDQPAASDQVDGPAPKVPSDNGTKTEVKPHTKSTPKPKPATQPTRLPGVATASTAASTAKKDTSHSPPLSTSTRSPTDRKSSAAPNLKAIPRMATNTTASSVAKSRMSLPAQTPGNTRPKSRVSTAADESVLARLMRPTAASERRAHEKTIKPDSPPRAKRDAPGSKAKAVKKTAAPKTSTHGEGRHGETGSSAENEPSPEASQLDDQQPAVVTQDAT